MVRTTFKYNLYKIIIFVVVFFLNQTIANHIEVFNVAPNLIFALVVCTSLTEDKISNIFFALASGLLFDFFNGKILGVYTILFVGISFGSSVIYHTFFENMTSVEILFSVLSCFLYSFLHSVFFGLRETNFIMLLTRVSLIEFIYNSIISVILILICKKLSAFKSSAWRIK